MPACPEHKCVLKPIGRLSLVCPRCGYKKYQSSKYWLPDVRNVVAMPSGFSWSTFTLTNLTTDADGYLVLSGTNTVGTALSPQISIQNSTKHVLRRKDITKATLDWDHSANDGKIQYAVSNDGGSHYTQIKTEDADFRLNHGKETPLQAYYYDLRLLITIRRDASGDTSPQVKSVVLKHDYK
jgi:hypothetical protein